MHRFSWSFLAVLLVLTTGELAASKPLHFVLQGFTNLSKGKGQTFTLTSDGRIESGPTLGTPIDLSTQTVWAVYQKADHSLLVGTSPDAKLLQVSDTGSVKTVAQSKNVAVTAIAGTADGAEIYFATSPDGKIYHLTANGTAEEWFDPKEKYIWCLLVGPDGAVYAGTGTHGKIYKITGKATGQVWYSSIEDHIRSMTWDKEGNILAGTAGNGYLYRVTGQEKGTVLASTSRQEISRIVLDDSGTIYYIATGLIHPAPADKSPSGSDEDEIAHTSSTADHKEADKSSGSAPDSKSGAELYSMDKSLAPRHLWHGEDVSRTLLCLNNQIYFSCDPTGSLYTVMPSGDIALQNISDNSITASVKMDEHTAYLATSHPAQLIKINTDTAPTSVYDSQALDSKSFSRWGRLDIAGANLNNVQLSVRTGNTPKPDATWNAWEPLAMNAEGFLSGAQVSSPAARFAQIEVKLTGNASVDTIDLAYLPKNQRPEIASITVLAPGIRYNPVSLPINPVAPRGPEQAAEGLEPVLHPEMNPTRFIPVFSAGYRTITWAAEDPDGDDMVYTVSCRSLTTPNAPWRVLASDLKDAIYSWDATSWPDGRYELKVLASDEKVNLPGEGLTVERVSRDLIINNTPPTITVQEPQNGAWLVDVTSALSRLRQVSISKDGKEYQAIQPVDGILDSNSEKFSIPAHAGDTVFLRAEDQAGNVSGKQLTN